MLVGNGLCVVIIIEYYNVNNFKIILPINLGAFITDIWTLFFSLLPHCARTLAISVRVCDERCVYVQERVADFLSWNGHLHHDFSQVDSEIHSRYMCVYVCACVCVCVGVYL